VLTYQIKAGTIDVSVVCRAIDATDGTPETAFDHATAGIDLQYRREGAANVAITEVDLAALTTVHTDGGVEQIGNGYFRLDLPDAACAVGVTGVIVHGVATGMVIIGCYIQLVAYDPFNAVRLGLTALPNAAADAAGGLPISDAGGLDLDAQRADVAAVLVDTSTTLQAEVDGIQADAEDIQARLPAALTAGGNIKADLVSILGTVLTETAGLLAGGFKKFFNVATPTGTLNSVPDAVAGAASGLAIVGSNMGTATSVTGAVGSVTGAVGSVAADVGITQAGADKVWSSAARTLTAFSTALAVSVWDVLAAAVAVASSIGLQIKTNLDVVLSTRLATSGYTAPPTVGQVADQVWDEALSGHLGVGSTGEALAAVKADAAAILVDTGTTLDGRIPAALSGAGNMKADALAVDGSTTAATNLKQSATVIYVGSVTGAATTTTLIDSALTQAATDFWKGRIIIFLTGTLKFQATDITAFDAALDKLTFTALTEAPAAADQYVIL